MKFVLEIWDYMPEMAAFMYFGVRLWIGKFNAEASIYKTRNGMLYFRVDLPLIHITNTMYQKAVSTGTDPQYHIRNLISGKIFGYKIKSEVG